jgi:hypothetical protein
MKAPFIFLHCGYELHSLYSSPNIVGVIKSRRMRCAGYVARVGEGRGVYRVLVGKPESKTPLGRPRRRWEDNIKMDLRWGELDSAGSGEGPVATFCEHGDEPSCSVKKASYSLTSCDSFSNNVLHHGVSK